MKNEKTSKNNDIINLKKDSKTINYKYYIIPLFIFIILNLTVVFHIGRYNNKNISKIEKENHVLLSQKEEKTNEISEEFKQSLRNILNEKEMIENELMSKHTTFRIGGPAKLFLKPSTIEQIVQIIKLCKKYGVHYFILGNGSNLLVSDEGYKGVVLYIHQSNFGSFEYTKDDETHYTLKVGAGMLMKELSIQACFLSLKDLDDIVDIPGTVGGGVIMHATAYSQGLSKPLYKVKVITPEGEILELTKEECQFRLRGSMLKDKKYLVIEAIFKCETGDQLKIQKQMTENTRKRYSNQPIYFLSAGCFFVYNHAKHGSLLEKYRACNLVSYQVGDVMVYTDNISFIVNMGKGTAKDVMAVVNHIKKTIKEKYNIDLDQEVISIGNFDGIEYY